MARSHGANDKKGHYRSRPTGVGLEVSDRKRIFTIAYNEHTAG